VVCFAQFLGGNPICFGVPSFMHGFKNRHMLRLYNLSFDMWFIIWLVLLISTVPVWLYSKLTIKSQYEVKRLIFTPINQPFYTLIHVGSKLTRIFIDICYGRVCIQYYDVRINYSFCGWTVDRRCLNFLFRSKYKTLNFVLTFDGQFAI
jgi:hypothetical protein